MENVRPFDFSRMFFGLQPPWYLLEVAFRTTWMYVFALVVVRYIGKRGLREMSTFEYVLIVALGSAVGDPMFYPEVPLLHGMMVVTVVVLIQRGVVRLMQVNKRAKDFFYKGEARLLVSEGEVVDRVRREEGFSMEEIEMILREQGIRSMGEVWRAYLEPSGEVSVFKQQDGPAPPGRSILPA